MRTTRSMKTGILLAPALAALALVLAGCLSGVKLPVRPPGVGPGGFAAITGAVVGSDGAPLDGVRVYACEAGDIVKVQKEFKSGKYRDKMPPSRVLYCRNCGKCGPLTGTNAQGRFTREYPPDLVRPQDLVIYRNDWQHVIVRGVTAPRDLGVIRLPGRDREPHANGITTREVK